jgi:hypothetical protein
MESLIKTPLPLCGISPKGGEKARKYSDFFPSWEEIKRGFYEQTDSTSLIVFGIGLPRTL